MQKVYTGLGVTLLVLLIGGCSPETASQSGREGYSNSIKPTPEVTQPTPITAPSSDAVSVPENISQPPLSKPEPVNVVEVLKKPPVSVSRSLEEIRNSPWPSVPRSSDLETSVSRYLVSLEMYRRALEAKRESLEVARREGVMQSKEYAAMIERYRQGIRAYRLGYARYKQRQEKP